MSSSTKPPRLPLVPLLALLAVSVLGQVADSAPTKPTGSPAQGPKALPPGAVQLRYPAPSAALISPPSLMSVNEQTRFLAVKTKANALAGAASTLGASNAVLRKLLKVQAAKLDPVVRTPFAECRC